MSRYSTAKKADVFTEPTAKKLIESDKKFEVESFAKQVVAEAGTQKAAGLKSKSGSRDDRNTDLNEYEKPAMRDSLVGRIA